MARDNSAMNDRQSPAPEGAGSAQGPAPARVTGPSFGRGLVIGVSGLALVVAALAAVLILRPSDDPVGQGGSTPSPTATAAPTEQATAEPSGPTDAPSSTPAPSAAADVPTDWTAAAQFGEDGKRYVVGDLVSWSGGLLAVGTVYEDEARSVFGPPPPRSGRVWRSDDGTSWTDATPDGTFADVELAHLFETADGALVVIGQSYPALDPVSAAWETHDGETWTPITLAGLPNGVAVFQVASGARGHVATAFLGGEAHAAFSSDGRTWEPTLEGSAMRMVAAGDEGFVAVVAPEGSQPAAERVVASADGKEWFDGTAPDAGIFMAAPRGGDWFATTATVGAGSSIDAATWGSANGLDWSPIGTIPLEAAGPETLGCHEMPAIVHGLPRLIVVGTVLTFGCGEGAVSTAGGSYASLDGGTWSRVPFGDLAYAAGAAEAGDRIVVATDTRTGQADVIGVTFWVSQP